MQSILSYDCNYDCNYDYIIKELLTGFMKKIITIIE